MSAGSTDFAESSAAKVSPFESIPYYHPPGEGQDGCNPRYAAGPTTCFLEPYRSLGPIFRCRFWGQERIAIGGVEANRFSWSDGSRWNYYKSNRIFREQFSKRYLNQLRGEEYRKKRRRTNQGFKPSLLYSHGDGMSRVIEEEIGKLPDGVADLRPFCMRLMICMTSRVLLQEDLPDGMDQIMARSNKEMLRSTSLGKLRWLWYWYPPKRWRRRRVFNYLNRILEERKRNPVERDDILSLILRGQPDTEPPIPRFELIHDLSQLMMAGSTTTAMLMTWSLLYLKQSEDWTSDLREELKDWDPSTLKKMEDFPKTRATCLEIERLKPSVPVFSRIAAHDLEFEGYLIPTDTWVLHLQTLCHFLDEVYDEPLAYRPGRFIGNPKLPAREIHGIYGGGEHACLGQNLARFATFLALAVIVSRYDWDFVDRPPSMKERYDVVTAPVEDQILVRFRRRDR